MSDNYNVVVVFYRYGVFVEVGCAVAVTELADGD